jgi:hypothetical protein
MSRAWAALPCVTLLLAAAPVCLAQWPGHPTPGIPRVAGGAPDMSAPAPRTADGHTDISGLWVPAAPYVVDDKGGSRPGQVPFQPWADALFKARFENGGRDDPSAYCLPGGVPRVDLIPYPFRILAVPGRTVVLYEIYSVFREILTDGRPLPENPNPTWMGYSVGHWEEEAFVVRSSGFNGKTWIDTNGRPATPALEVLERFRRKNFGYMDLDITVVDPVTYTRPWSIRVPLHLAADTEMIEYVCNENNKYPQVVPAQPVPVTAPPSAR